MRILLIGRSGQVGRSLQAALHGHELTAPDSASCNLLDQAAVRKNIRTFEPDVILNAAAYTAVDAAETDLQKCFAINSDAPKILAEESNRLGALLIHYSTDYAFDGRKNGAYTEIDEANPLNVYGESKILGDKNIQEASDNFIIFRVSWVYSNTGRNFLKTILRLANERTELDVVADQIGAPTSADLIAQTTVEAIRRLKPMRSDMEPLSGLYNLAAAGTTSWHGFAVEIVRQAHRYKYRPILNEDRIRPITTASYPTPAVRPRNSALDTAKLQADLRIDFPDWRRDVEKTIAALAVNPL